MIVRVIGMRPSILQLRMDALERASDEKIAKVEHVAPFFQS